MGAFRPELIALAARMPGKDLELWRLYVDHAPGRIWAPDIVLAPDGRPYLYRWYLAPRYEDMKKAGGLVMFHLQVRSDPERPLHDHPWDNQSVILAGGYDEWYISNPPGKLRDMAFRCPCVGDVVTRKAAEAHRLILPEGVPHTMTLFSTGPKVREWGFWYLDGWHHNDRHVADRNGVSVHEEGEAG